MADLASFGRARRGALFLCLIAGLLGFPATRVAATAGPEVDTGRYIVMAPGTAGRGIEAFGAVGAVPIAGPPGVEIVSRLPELGITVVEMDQATAKLMASDSSLIVEADAQVSVADVSWGLDSLDSTDGSLDGRFAVLSDGSGVDVFVFDTGIWSEHNQLAGRVGSSVDVIGARERGVALATTMTTGSSDCHGHGTHVASVVAGRDVGVAPGAVLHAVRVLGCDGRGRVSDLVAGIDWVLQHKSGPSIVNLSIGGNRSRVLDSAVERLINAGVVVTVAAGNESTDACNFSPGHVAAAITVGAVDRDDTVPHFSNYGTCVDVAAPGTAVLGASLGGVESLRVLSGTSQAAPFVAGIAALILSDQPDLSAADVERLVLGAARATVSPTQQGVPSLGATAVPEYLIAELLPVTVLANPWFDGRTSIIVIVTVESVESVRIAVRDGSGRSWVVEPDDQAVATLHFLANSPAPSIVIDGRPVSEQATQVAESTAVEVRVPSEGLVVYELAAGPKGETVRHLLWFDDVATLSAHLPVGAQVISVERTTRGPRTGEWLGSGWQPERSDLHSTRRLTLLSDGA